MTLGFGLFIHLSATSGTTQIVLFQILAGTGAGIAFTSPLIALQSQISVRDNATATSTFGFIRNLAAAISVVLGGVVFQNGIQSQATELTTVLGAEVAARFSGKNAAANVLVLNTLGTAQKLVVREAYALSLRKMWILYACTSAAGLVASAFIGRIPLSVVHEEATLGLESEERRRLELMELDAR